MKIQSFLVDNLIWGFLCLTFVISLLSFALMLLIPGTESPESAKGLPVWLIAIWSPNISAIIIWSVKNELIFKLKIAYSLPAFNGWSNLSLLPLLIAGLLILASIQKGHVIEWSNFKFEYLLPLIMINLIMGPLGEELGWRGLLYPSLRSSYGWMAGALIVALIWSIWHAPLWLLDSPQSKIPFWAFLVNVTCLSIMMAMIYNHSQGSLFHVILLHLTFNVSLALIDLLKTHEPGEYFIKSLYLYVPITLILVSIHESTKAYVCNL